MISEELKNDLKIKWDRMRDGMAKMGMDACLLTVDVNLYYTTGQIYSGYFYLPVDGEPWFLIKRPNGLSGHQVEYIRKPEDIPPLFAERGIKMPKKLLLEADELTYNEYIRLDKVFQPEEAGNATAFMRNLRRVKTPWEIGQFRIAARKHEATYSEIPECFRPGTRSRNVCARTARSVFSVLSEPIWISIWVVFSPGKTPRPHPLLISPWVEAA